MFLQSLPEMLRWLILFIIGTCLGALINLCIYRLAFFVNRNISPWSPPPSAQRPRTFRDRIPVLGWLFLRRESDVFGKGFWIRPLFIELCVGLGLLWFWQWNMQGGLYGGSDVRIVAEQIAMTPRWNFGWFLFHSSLIALMIVATFIDFDEQIIPDWVTVPGTIIALLGHVISPTLRLPFIEPELLANRIGSLSYWSPDAPSFWHEGPEGILVALIILAFWFFMLLPKTLTLRFGLVRGLQFLVASILRPRRRTTAAVGRIQTRQIFSQTKVFAGITITLMCLCGVVYWLGGERWSALFDSLLGLAMGGGVVWAVRIIASQALGEEAMGLGDVTLMTMIGAFLGWQAALLTFVLAPFTSILVAVAQVVFKRENRLAFGPYLCLAAMIVLIGWNFVWNEWAAKGVFEIGGTFLLVVILVCLGLMGLMLGGWRLLQAQFTK